MTSVTLIGVCRVEGESDPTPSTARLGGLRSATEAFLAAGLVEQIEAAGGVVARVVIPEMAAEESTGDPITDLGRFNGRVAEAVTTAVHSGTVPVLAGGTCNHLIGMIAGLQSAHEPPAKIGLVWLDAHGDFNTPETTRSGMLGGMPVAVVAGLCHPTWRELAGQREVLPTSRILFVDVRNLDPDEATLVEGSDATIAHFGPDDAIDEIVAAAHSLAASVDHIYLHVDADVLDEAWQPNHPTAEPDGPSLLAVTGAIKAVMATGQVRAFGVVSVNPSGAGGEMSLASAMALLHAGIGSLAAAGADV